MIEPIMQVLYVRIIWLPVIYSLCAMLEVIYGIRMTLLDLVRDGFEAYGIFCFIVMIFVHIQGEQALCDYMEKNRHSLKHFGFFCRVICNEFDSGHSFVRFIRISILQFVILKPILALSMALLEIKVHDLEHPYHKDNADEIARLGRLENLVVFLTFVVVVTALYALFNCYFATKALLQGLHPLTKFIAIKALVAVTIVQRLLCKAALATGNMPGNNAIGLDPEEQALRIQNFLICIDMVLFTIVFYFAFSYTEFKLKASTTLSMGDTLFHKIMRSLRFWDIFHRVDRINQINEMRILDSSSPPHAQE